MSAKGKSLPPALKALLKEPTFAARSSRATPGLTLPAGRAAGPMGTPSDLSMFSTTLQRFSDDATERGIGWGEWLSLVTATLMTLNSPGSLQELHRHVAPASLSIQQRVERACLMREVGLKCIGFIGIPKVINQLAALRSAVDEDGELKDALPTKPRRKFTANDTDAVQRAAYALWDDIYTPVSDRLLDILGHSHPDLPVFIVDSEYGPLFSPPSLIAAHQNSAATAAAAAAPPPTWEVNRLRTSLVAIAGLRAQGGVGPQVTSHIWGLLKSGSSIAQDDPHRAGLQWLASEEGALWAVRVVDGVCEAVEGAVQEQEHEEKQQRQAGKRESKL